ncbi:U2-type prespliceosome protein [Malassezia pachydermatis]
MAADAGSPRTPTDGTVISAWVEHRNAQGRVYWYHPGERRSVWDKPDELKSARERAMDSTPWREYKSGERSYYVNKETKQSTWTMPSDLKAYLDSIPDDPPKAIAARPSASPRPAPGEAGGASTPLSAPGSGTPEPMGPGTAAPRQSSSIGGGSNIRSAPLMYNSYEEAEAAFISLLRLKQVGPDSTWEQTLRVIVTEPLYKALRSLADRKAAFTKYVQELKDEQAAQREAKEEKLRPAMARALQQQRAGMLKPYASFATFKKRLQDTSLWAELDDEAQAHTIFEAIRHDAREKDAVRQKHVNTHNRTALEALLKSIDMQPTTLWRDVHRTILESDEYRSDARLQTMSLSDMLQVFEAHMATVEGEARAAQTQQDATSRRKDREARDAFHAMMQAHIDDGTMHARSTWTTYYAVIRHDARLDAMLATQGSTAQELFYDRLDELERAFATQRRHVQAYMKENNILASRPSDWGIWREACQSSKAPEAIRTLSERALQALFDECLYQAERDAREARRRAERRLRHAADDLRYACKHVDPPLDIHASFEEIVPRLRDLPEFRRLAETSDGMDVARSAWDRFARRQAEKQADARHAPGRSRTDYTDLDDASDERKRKDLSRAEDPRAVRRRTEYDT